MLLRQIYEGLRQFIMARTPCSCTRRGSARAAGPLPVRASQERPKTRKMSSRGKRKIVDPRQQTIKKFFQVNDAEATGKLESSDCLNLEAENAGMGGGAAGVSSPESDAGLSGESEKELLENN